MSNWRTESLPFSLVPHGEDGPRVLRRSQSPTLLAADFRTPLDRTESIGLASEAGYDAIAGVFDASPWAKFWDRNEQPLLEKVISELGGIDTALDIGSGTGRYSRVLLKYARTVIGVDISEGMTRIAKSKVKAGNFIKSDIWSFLPAAQKFDVVVCARVLSHVPNAEKLVRTIVTDHLTDHGVIVISDLHPRHSYGMTSFEVGGFRINLDTFKHDIGKFQVMNAPINWTLKEFYYEDLNWKPSPHRFSTVRRETGLPIFYMLVGRRRPAW